MFRYIALSWDASVSTAAACAHTLAQALAASPGWQQELQHPRLLVFSSGAIRGVNQAYPLRDGRGVVLGRLFDRNDPQASTDRIAHSIAESDRNPPDLALELLKRRWGRYIMFFESGHDDIQVLRDPGGTLPCYGLRHDGVTIVFAWLEDVIQLLPQIPLPEVDTDALAASLAFGELTGRRTALKGVTQVLAGERLSLQRMEEPVGPLAWDASLIAGQPVEPGDAEAAAVLRETVNTCVQAWARCYGGILLRLSGGLDSSILASCLAPGRTPATVTCLNYHSAGHDSDEREFARLAAARSQLDLIESERQGDFPLERILAVARTPLPQHYVGRLTSRSDAETARLLGATALFTGAGGDQLFFEIPQWWPAADYLRLRGMDRGLPAAVLDAARLGRVSVWRTLRLAALDLLRGKPPVPEHHRSRTLITDAVRRQAHHPGGFLHPAFLARTSLPIGKLAQVQQLAYQPAYYDPLAREQAPELVNPLLSQPLVELCLRLPTFVLTRGGTGRALARAAFRGEIPDAIVHRRSKGGMGRHFDAVLAANIDFARQVLLDGELVRLGLLDRAALERALSGREAGGPTPAGEVHIVLGVEAWLRRFRGPRAA
jgi:asparagine synthase (glutamine-hydrolysing)